MILIVVIILLMLAGIIKLTRPPKTQTVIIRGREICGENKVVVNGKCICDERSGYYPGIGHTGGPDHNLCYHCDSTEVKVMDGVKVCDPDGLGAQTDLKDQPNPAEADEQCGAGQVMRDSKCEPAAAPSTESDDESDDEADDESDDEAAEETDVCAEDPESEACYQYTLEYCATNTMDEACAFLAGPNSAEAESAAGWRHVQDTVKEREESWITGSQLDQLMDHLPSSEAEAECPPGGRIGSSNEAQCRNSGCYVNEVGEGFFSCTRTNDYLPSSDSESEKNKQTFTLY